MNWDGSGDLQQIILESTGPAVTAVETALALAADTGEDTWLDRLSYLTEDELMDNISSYIPETEGQDIAPSAVMQYYLQDYGDNATLLSDQWQNVHDNMLWYEKFTTDHDLKQHDGESDEDYSDRYDSIIDEMRAQAKANPEKDNGEFSKYLDHAMLYPGLYMISYPGVWGDTLGDFFNPQEDASYTERIESFLPLAVALSEGQRSALSILSLESLLKLGFADEENFIDQLPDITELLDGMERISIYAGSNRTIFRGNVALTKEAVMQAVGSDDPSDLWSMSRGVNILAACALIGAAVSIIGGVNCFIRAKNYLGKVLNPKETKFVLKHPELVKDYMDSCDKYYDLERIRVRESLRIEKSDRINLESEYIRNLLGDETVPARDLNANIKAAEGMLEMDETALTNAINQVDAQNEVFKQNLLCRHRLDYITYNTSEITAKRTLGYVLIGVGIALTLTAIITKVIDIATYSKTKEEHYHRDFTTIPMMIVDKKDIVTTVEDEYGELHNKIEFDQYVYYEAVKCNRQDVGRLDVWQNGVENYQAAGCGDAADLNADYALEWLALYTIKSPKKGAPILADSLKLTYGSKTKPDVHTPSLHLIGYSAPIDVADKAYCYGNKKRAIYFSWQEDK